LHEDKQNVGRVYVDIEAALPKIRHTMELPFPYDPKTDEGEGI
jgi:hypothetical protein